jgi:hypothetical protein
MLCSVAFLAALGAPPTRQAESWEIASQAESFRRTWLEQVDSLDVCSLSEAHGFVDVQGDSVSNDAHSLLRRWRERACPPARAPHASRRVSVSALAVDGEEARLELTVSRGERLHREVYSLRRRPSPFGWAVIDMRVTGLLVRVLPPSFDAASHAGNDHVARVRWLRCSEHLVPRAEGARRYLTPAAQQCWPISRGVDHQRAAMTLVQVHKRRFIRAREIQPA